ncbi:MAG: hypothetical protein OEV36_06955 [Myxococcales bacterium]|nr:hypothetical protein [Myxococcales bacterium]
MIAHLLGLPDHPGVMFLVYFTFWDRIAGTYRSPEVDDEDVPAGILYRPPSRRPASPASSALPDGPQTTR